MNFRIYYIESDIEKEVEVTAKDEQTAIAKLIRNYGDFEIIDIQEV